jgi:hypothetical protein
MKRWVFIFLLAFSSYGVARAQSDGQLSIALPTLGGDQLWTDQLVHGKWRIQRNELTGHHRLLDPSDVRCAWGTRDECQAAFESLKREHKLPALHGKAVITLHGLGRSRNAMSAIGHYIEQQGDYTWINVSYASTRNTLDEHAHSLAGVIDALQGITEIDFVCHSLGNLVVRRYLGEATQETPRWKTDPRIRRMVMLAPPNHGAQLARVTADLLQDNQFVRVVVGASAWQLAREWEDAQKKLATPHFEFGIIAGGFGQTGLNPLLGGNDDLVVTVEETRLAGAEDFCLVACRHGGILSDSAVLQHITTFLQHGYFKTAAEKQPILARPQPEVAGAGQ